MIARIVLILITALAIAGCGTRSASTENTVVAAFYPLAFAAKTIAPSLTVENLTPPGAEPHDLDQRIERRPHEPDRARAEVVHSPGRRREGRPGIPMRDELARDGHAHGQVELHAELARPRPKRGGRQQHREPRSHSETIGRDELVAVVDRHVAHTRGATNPVAQPYDRQRVAQLILLAEQGPLLSERVHPGIGVAKQLESADVLHRVGLLVVRLFDQEAVVGDGRCSCGVLGHGAARAEQTECDGDGIECGRAHVPSARHHNSCASSRPTTRGSPEGTSAMVVGPLKG